MTPKEKLLAMSHEEKIRFISTVDHNKASNGKEILCMDNQLRVLVRHICDLDNENELYEWEDKILEVILDTYLEK